MAVQVAFLVIAALLTVTAAHPYDSRAKAEEDLECDEDSSRTITFGSANYDLRVCRKSKWHSTVVYTNLYECYVKQTTLHVGVSMDYQNTSVVLKLAIAKQ